MPTMNSTMLADTKNVSVTDDIEYIDEKDIESQWVESISLPMYSPDENARKFTLVNDTYTYIKHMMTGLELKQNVDYIIVPPRLASETKIEIKFRSGCEGYASMCVMIWERYKTAKIESNL